MSEAKLVPTRSSIARLALRPKQQTSSALAMKIGETALSR